MLPAVGYVRISDEKQIGNTSIDTQKELITGWAEKLGYQIIHFCIDEAVSAYHKSPKRRKAVIDLMNLLNSGAAIAVVFNEETRLDRQFSPWVREVFKPVKEVNPLIKFFQVGSVSEWDPWNIEVMINLFFARVESENKAGRALDTQSNMLNKESKHPGSRPPYGYDYDLELNKLVPNQESETVYLMFYLASWGYSSQRIALVLTQLKIIPPHSTQWNPSSVDSVLSNEIYVGKLWWRVTNKENHIPSTQTKLYDSIVLPIVPEYIWDIAQALRKMKQTNPRSLSTPNFLLDRIICGQCGERLKAKDQSPSKSKGKYLKYYCLNCKISYPVQELDKEVIQKFLQDWINDSEDCVSTATSELRDWQHVLEHENEHLVSKINDLRSKKSLCTEDVPSCDIWTQVLSQTETQVERELSKVSEMLSQIKNLLQKENVSQIFGHFRKHSMLEFNEVELRTICLLILKKVVVSPDGKISVDYRLNPLFDLSNSLVIKPNDLKSLG